MTKLASRADLHYFIAFVGGIATVVIVGMLESFIVMHLPAPQYQSIASLNYQVMLQNSMIIAAGLTGYAAGFVGLIYLLRRLGGRPRRQGLRLGAVVATLLLAALVLVGFNIPTDQQTPSANVAVWQDFATVLAVGGFYMVGWFLATHYGKDKL